jgi:Spy/CpxP family protein refolding chaperone
MNRITLTFAAAVAALVAAVAIAPALAQAQPRPDTEFCAKMRKQDPGGICSPKGEYVTPEKVYLPDGKVITRSTGDAA